MQRRQLHIAGFLPLLLLCLASLALTESAHAFHFPWDQGHDTFEPDPGDEDTDPGDDEHCLFGSPFEPASGNFQWQERDILIPGPGIFLNVTRFYNSHDLRSGIFGRGWSFTYDQRLVLTFDGSAVFAICHSPNGRRLRFQRNPDGSFTPPPTSFDSLVQNADDTFTIRRKNGIRFEFDPSGMLTALIDRNGNALAFDYDSTGFLTRVADDGGRTLDFSKGPDGRVASVVDPAGRVYRYAYDADGNLTSYFDPLGHETRYSYTAGGKLEQIHNANDDLLQSLAYDGEGRLVSYIEDRQVWSVRYLADRTEKTDSLGATWILRFDEEGSITEKQDPSGATESFEYDADRNLVRHTNKNGNSVRLTYDSAGNVASLIDPVGGVTRLEYEPNFFRLASLTNPLGDKTTYRYDSRGNLIEATNAVGDSLRYTYTARGQVASQTDALGGAVTFAYDTRGDLDSTTDALGEKTTFVHDEVGRLISTTDRDGKTTRYEYDDADRLTHIVDDAGGDTTYVYDAVGNLVSLTDAMGATTSYVYDSFDQLSRRTDPSGRAETFTYDPQGNVATHVDRLGRTTSYTYDALGRLLRKQAADNDITFTYDAHGNVLTVEDLDSSLTYDYDALSRVSSVRSSVTFGAQPDVTLSYSYDAASQLTTATDSRGGQTRYEFDPAGRMVKAVTPSGKTIDLSYDGRDRVRQIEYPNGLVTAFRAGAASRLDTIETSFAAGPVLSSIQYRYTDFDSVETIVRDGVARTLTYDSRRQITQVQGASHSEQYTYDAVGNRSSSHRSSLYSFDASHRLLEDDSSTFAYDANGNRIEATRKSDGAATSYAFDGENRLVGVQRPDGSLVEYRYDGWGRRIAKVVDGDVRRYVHSFSDVVLELDGAGATTARYTHGSQLDQPLSMERGGTDYYYHHDYLGSITLVTDTVGAVANAYDYDSFGNFLQRTESVESPYAFTAREFDEESGLYFYRARHYDPAHGRFVSEDPVGFAGRDVNLYRYVWNDPSNHTDPSGLIPLDTIWDLGNVIYDIIVGDCEALALDLAAMAVPYLPAGVTKIDDAVRLGDKALDAGKSVTRRPRNFRKKTVQDSWDNAANGSKPGTKACPTCGKDVEVAPGQGPRDWDVDHQPPWSQRDLDGMTRKDVLDEYNRGTRLECPSCNRSRGATPADDGGG